jgi:hypothetical protein
MRSSGTHAVVLAALAIVSIALTNCSGSGGNASTTVPKPKASPGTNLYVANEGSLPDFAQFVPTFSASSAPSFSIQYDGIGDVASDATYVVANNFDSPTLEVFAQPISASSTPTADITDPSTAELSTFDSSGDLWETLDNSTVVEFTPPLTNASTAAVVVSTDVFDPVGIAFDSSGNLYVVNADSNGSTPPQLLVFAPPYTGTPTILNLPVGTPSEAYGVDVSGEELAVSVFEQPTGARTRFGSAGATHSIVRRGSPARTHAGAISRKGVLTGGEILIYPLPISPTSEQTATIPLLEAGAVRFDTAGNLYVTDEVEPTSPGSVLVFSPPFSDSSTDAFAITNGIDDPTGLNFGP